MFRIVCFIEDKNLAKVLHAMSGLVLNMEPPQPVINATISKSVKQTPPWKQMDVPEIKQTSVATSIKGRLAEYLDTIKGARVSIADLRTKWVEFGGLPTSLNGSLMTELAKEGHVKRVARGQYLIT